MRTLRITVAAIAALVLATLPGTAGAAGCTITWDGGAAGAWATPANWTEDRVPNAGDHACVNAPASVTSSAAVTVDHFTLGAGATLSITAGGFRAEHDSASAGTINLSSGSELRMDDGSAGTTETLTSTGTLSSGGGQLTGTFRNQGGIDVIAGATLTVTGRLIQDDGGVIAGPGKVSITGGSTRLQVSGGAMSPNADVDLTGGFLNSSEGAGVEFVDAAGASGSVAVAGNGKGIQRISGDVPTGYTVRIEDNSWLVATASFKNAGTIALSGAEPVLRVSDRVPGTTETLTNNGTLSFAGAGPQTLAGDVVNAGGMAVAATSVGFGSDDGGRVSRLANSGVLEVPTGSTFTASGAELSQLPGASITGGGRVAVAGGSNGRLAVAGGTVDAATDLRVSGACCGGNPGASLHFTGAAASGKVTIGGVGDGDGRHAISGAVPAGFAIDVSATNRLVAADDWSSAGTLRLTGNNAVVASEDGDAATAEKLTSTGTIALSGTGPRFLAGDLVNQGSLTVTTAEAQFVSGTDDGRQATFTNAGALAVPLDQKLAFTSTRVVQAQGGSITGPGRVTVGGGGSGRLEVTGGTIDESADLRVSGACCGGNPGAALAFPAPSAATGRITIGGAGDGEGNHALSGDVPAGITIDVLATNRLLASADWKNAGTIRLAGANAVLQTGAGGAADVETLTNTGVLAGVGGSGPRFFGGDIANQGVVRVDNPDTRFVNADARTVRLTNAATGTIDVQAGGVATFVATHPLASSGTITVAGSLLTNGFVQSAGATTVAAPGRLNAATIDGGLLAGAGTVQGALTNGGEVSPGGSGIGTLKVTGAYTQTATGKLTARVQQGGGDQLDADGAATLDGTLALSAGSPAPAQGATFKVLDASSRTGQFATVAGADSGPFDVQYEATGVTLLTGSPGPLPEVSIADATAVEGDAGTTALTFTVSLSAAAGFPVAVDYDAFAGTAASPADFAATAGTLTFQPGVTQQAVTVPVGGDSAGEPDETLTVELDAPDRATVGDGSARGTILNDDLALTRISPDRAGDGGTAEVTLHGAGLVAGTVVRLSRGGEEIVAQSVTPRSDSGSAAAVLDLEGRAQGAWDVTATLPEGRDAATMAGAFTIEAARPADVWIKFASGSKARQGIVYDGWLTFGNTGNVDATGVVVELAGLPRFDPLKLPFELPEALVSWNARGRKVTFFVPRLGPGAVAHVPFESRFSTIGRFSLKARITDDQFPVDDLPLSDPATTVRGEFTEASDSGGRAAITVTGPRGGALALETTSAAASGYVPPTFSATEPAPGQTRLRVSGATELSSGVFRAYETTITGAASVFDAALRAGSPTSLAGTTLARSPLGRIGEAIGPVAKNAGSLGRRGFAQTANCFVDQFAAAGTPGPLGGLLTNAINQAPIFEKAGSLAPARIGGIAGPVGQLGAQITGSLLDARSAQEALLLDAVKRFGEATGAPAPPDDGTIHGEIDKRCPEEPPAPGGGGGGGAGAGGGGGGGGGGGPAPGGADDELPIRVGAAHDPNEKVGPPGAGDERYVEGDRPLPYTVRFENLPSATLPAQVVTITDQLDAAKLDLATVALGPVTFGDAIVNVPPGLQSYTTDVDLRPANDLVVRVTGALDRSTGVLTWRLESIDPRTGAPTTDPDAGFLPPNVTPGEGEGSVAFTVSPVPGLPDGTVIANSASIVFDVNAPIVTNTWSNTIDRSAPVSRATAAPAAGCDGAVKVDWSGTDAGSGVESFDVYAAGATGPFSLWQSGTSAASAVWDGEPNTTYRFLTVARDRAGHVESGPYADPASARTSSCPSGPPPAAKATLKLLTKQARLDRRRRIALRVRCTAAPCTGALRLDQRRRRTAAARFSVPAGRTARVRVRFSKRVVKRIRRAGKAKLRVRQMPAGLLLGTVTVRPPKARRK